MKIGLDFDDVICYTHGLKPVLAKKFYGVDIPESLCRKDYIVRNNILTAEQYLKVALEVFSGKYEAEPVYKAIEGIRFLKQEGHSLKIVTSRSDKQGILESAKAWLRKHELDIPIVGVPYGESKARACVGLDFFVDDDPAKLKELVGTVENLIFFCWPHNQNEIPPANSLRVRGWDDIIEHFAGNL